MVCQDWSLLYVFWTEVEPYSNTREQFIQPTDNKRTVNFTKGRCVLLLLRIRSAHLDLSMNPELDIGQVEGAFMMGLGMWLTEKIVYDPQTGRNLTNGTWVRLVIRF